MRAAWLGVLPLLLAAGGDGLELPESTSAQPVTGPTARVTVFADGGIAYEGQTISPGADPVLPELSSRLRTWRTATPEGLVLIAGDRRADFHSVRSVLASGNDAGVEDWGLLAAPDAAPGRAIRIAQRIAPGDALAQAGTGPPLPPLTLHLRAGEVAAMRQERDTVHVPRVDGALPLPMLAVLLDEDRRLHPSATVVVINTDDGVAYADTFSVLDLTREKGYSRTLLAGGQPAAEAQPPRSVYAPLVSGTAIEVRPDGSARLVGAEGGTRDFPHTFTTGYEAHCDAVTCDLVLRTANERVAMGTVDRAALFPYALFGRPLLRWEERLGEPGPERTGRLSPLVALPGDDGGDAVGGAPILLGSLDKSHIAGVIADRMEDIRGCYQSALQANRTVRGNVVVKFVIAKDGTVSSAVIKSSDIADTTFQSCVTDTFRTFRFDAPKGGGIVIVSYPFVFAPG